MNNRNQNQGYAIEYMYVMQIYFLSDSNDNSTDGAEKQIIRMHKYFCNLYLGSQ